MVSQRVERPVQHVGDRMVMHTLFQVVCPLVNDIHIFARGAKQQTFIRSRPSMSVGVLHWWPVLQRILARAQTGNKRARSESALPRLLPRHTACR